MLMQQLLTKDVQKVPKKHNLAVKEERDAVVVYEPK